jgi:hypothetical protein
MPVRREAQDTPLRHSPVSSEGMYLSILTQPASTLESEPVARDVGPTRPPERRARCAPRIITSFF